MPEDNPWDALPRELREAADTEAARVRLDTSDWLARVLEFAVERSRESARLVAAVADSRPMRRVPKPPTLAPRQVTLPVWIASDLARVAALEEVSGAVFTEAALLAEMQRAAKRRTLADVRGSSWSNAPDNDGAWLMKN